MIFLVLELLTEFQYRTELWDLQGKIKIADDFDILPEDIAEAFGMGGK